MLPKRPKIKDTLLRRAKRTYNTGDSLVVTDPTANPALASLSWEIERDPEVYWRLWSYVEDGVHICCYILGAGTTWKVSPPLKSGK